MKDHKLFLLSVFALFFLFYTFIHFPKALASNVVLVPAQGLVINIKYDPVLNTPPPGDQPPIGYLTDPVQCTGPDQIYGWSCDPDRTGAPIFVHIYLDGVWNAAIPADQVRSGDTGVAAMCGGNPAHWYGMPIPDSYRDGANHTVQAYGINVDSNGILVGVNNTYLSLASTNAPGAATFNCAPPPTPTPTPTPPPTPPASPVLTVGTRYCAGPSNNIPQVQISWTNSANADHYHVVRYDAGNGTSQPVGPNNGDFAQGNYGYLDSPPTSNEWYYYTIYAVGLTGLRSSTYQAAQFTTPNCTTPTITSVTSSCASGGTIPQTTTAWNNNITNGAPIDGVNISRRVNGGALSYLTTVSGNASPWTDQNKAQNTTYGYVVQTVVYGSPSSDSNEGSTSTGWCDPTPPTISLPPTIANACFDDKSTWPLSLDATTADPPPPANPSGVAFVTPVLKDASGNTMTTPTVTNKGGGIYGISIPKSSLSNASSYVLTATATDNAGNVSAPASYAFSYQNSCVGWIQTHGGNVHTEGNINAPGGP